MGSKFLFGALITPECPAVGKLWYCLSMFCFSSNVSSLDNSSAGKVDLSMNLSGIACFGSSLSLSSINFWDKASAAVFLLPAIYLILIL